ncbi:MalY/PatB family protein [Aerococcus sp. UMB1112A]|uniref:MalY/PatB family protein n=1 Tax=Aerococcus sp. UMB1112A TaxID=3050609 RepID=UPI002550E035|nr:MalY/PatB family protein [Aerococcus sp. UMB1112A]MDK8502431.1 MalY/PatB family protein [Aerococcus sp. UMB1112A]
MSDFDRIHDRRGTYCTQWDYVQDRFGVSDLLPFTISDTDFAAPDCVQDAIQKRIQHPVYGYTRWNHEDFKESVVNWYKRRFQLSIDPDGIVYSPSVMYTASQLIASQSAPGDGVVVQTPGYDAFFKVIEGNQRRIIENPLIYDNGQYYIDFEHLVACLKEPKNKVLLFCSPHNPTGRVWTVDELEIVYQLCQKHNVYLISDEIHMDVLRQGVIHHPLMEIGTEGIAVITSASKTFNIPSLIFSYAFILDESIREDFLYRLKNKDGLSSASCLGLEATMASYRGGSTWVDELNTYIQVNEQIVDQYLAKNLPEIYRVPANASYLLWLDISQLSYSMDQIQKGLVHKGRVAIMDGRVYRGNGGQFLRLNIGCPKKKLEEGLERMLVGIKGIEE